MTDFLELFLRTREPERVSREWHVCDVAALEMFERPSMDKPVHVPVRVLRVEAMLREIREGRNGRE